MKLETVVPWRRSFNEYKQMFSLNEEDLKKTIPGCGDEQGQSFMISQLR